MDVLNFLAETHCLNHQVHRVKPDTVTVESHAEQQLRYIRQTMTRASTYTMVPGWGGVWMGFIAITASVVATWAEDDRFWLAIWFGAAVLAVTVGVFTVARKAKKAQTPIFTGPGLRFWMCLSTAVAVGLLLTVALYERGLFDLMPGVWMLLFGMGVTTGGVFSVRLVPVIGVGFLITGGIALFLPLNWGNVLMAISFGGFDIVAGYLIARNYGG